MLGSHNIYIYIYIYVTSGANHKASELWDRIYMRSR